MLYLELAMGKDDYLTEKEYRFPSKIRNFCWNLKNFFGIVVRKKIDNKTVFVIPKVNKKFLKKIDKLLNVDGSKCVCISEELFYKEDFLNFLTSKNLEVFKGGWLKKYILENILEYIFSENENMADKEIAFMVNSEYELVVEYIKKLAPNFKLVTVITNNIRKFEKIEEKYLSNTGVCLNIVNNYRKSLSKTDIIINLDFDEKEIKKYNVFNKAIFINLKNNYELVSKNFDGINIIDIQIALPNKYLKYVELFYNFNYFKVYESLIKKNTSMSNIFKEIKNDKLEIVCLENQSGIVLKKDLERYSNKVLDK